MTDLEMMELAAKAAGLEVWRWNGFQSESLFRSAANPDGKVTGVEWNPLKDDGDALRLAVNLGMHVFIDMRATSIGNIDWDEDCNGFVHGDDALAATRRAIVRAAAAIGERP